LIAHVSWTVTVETPNDEFRAGAWPSEPAGVDW
jgi:hypothetical protein